jgi:hypothetical protein
MNNTENNHLNPLNHIGHEIVIDKFARDFRISRPPGNGFCMNCAAPVSIDVQRSGVFTKADAKRLNANEREQ